MLNGSEKNLEKELFVCLSSESDSSKNNGISLKLTRYQWCDTFLVFPISRQRPSHYCREGRNVLSIRPVWLSCIMKQGITWPIDRRCSSRLVPWYRVIAAVALYYLTNRLSPSLVTRDIHRSKDDRAGLCCCRCCNGQARTNGCRCQSSRPRWLQWIIQMSEWRRRHPDERTRHGAACPTS